MRSSADTLVFKRIELAENIEIDTLERFHNDSLLFVNIVRNGHLGNFAVYCGFIRKFKSGSVIYQADDFEPFRASHNYIAQVDDDKLGIVNWGWFNIGDSGRLVESLPRDKELLDSLKLYYSPLYFVNANNRGDFFVYQQGNLKKTINYGNLILRDSSVDFYKFDSEVLKLEGGKLQKMRFSTPEEIFKNGKGLYFVAKPGLGIVRKFTKGAIIKTLLSYQTKSDCPKVVKISQ
jgi:hypothetical protein